MSKNIKKVLRKKKRVSQTLPIIAMLAALGVSSLTYSVTVSADSGTSTTAKTSIYMPKGKKQGSKGDHQGIGGTVTAVNGSAITITGRNASIYTVDASNATFVKVTESTQATSTNGVGSHIKPFITSATVGDVTVGSTVMVRGTITSNHVVATQVAVGTFTHKTRVGTDASASMKERVKPAAAGVVQSINGSLVTIKDRNNTTYTVDVSSANILRGGRGQNSTTITVSDVKVGDMLGAKGVLTGSTVVATEVMTSVQHPFMKKLHDAMVSSNK